MGIFPQCKLEKKVAAEFVFGEINKATRLTRVCWLLLKL